MIISCGLKVRLKPVSSIFKIKQYLSNFSEIQEIMVAIDSLKNNFIDRILATKNEKLLTAISNIVDSTQSTGEIIKLSSEQIEMLTMRKKDIENGKLVSESDLNKTDADWLS